MSENYERLVTDFLMDAMSPEEIELFKKQLEENEELRKELKFQRSIFDAMVDQGEFEAENTDFKNSQLPKSEEPKFQETPSPHVQDAINQYKQDQIISKPEKDVVHLPTRRKLLPAVAAAILLFFLCYWLFNLNSIQDSEKLALQYIKEPFNLQVTGIDRSINANPVLRDKKVLFLEEFEQESYLEASRIMKEVINLEKEKGENYCSAGICELRLDQPNYLDAIRFFEKADSLGFSDKASLDWHVALSYLLSNKPQQAREILLNIKQQQGVYAKKAAKLLRTMGKP